MVDTLRDQLSCPVTYKIPRLMQSSMPILSFMFIDWRTMIHHGMMARTMSAAPDHATDQVSRWDTVGRAAGGIQHVPAAKPLYMTITYGSQHVPVISGVNDFLAGVH